MHLGRWGPPRPGARGRRPREANRHPSYPVGMEPDETSSAGRSLPVDLRDWVRFTPGAAVRVRVQRTAALAVDLWCLEPAQATDVLRCSGDVTYTVLAGRSWFVTEDGEVGLDPLGSLLVPADVAHGIDNRAPDPLIVLAVSSPPDVEPVAAPVSDAGVAIRDADTARRGALARLSRRRRDA